MSATDCTGPTDGEIVARFGHLLNNTGGNPPLELLSRLDSEERLAFSNLFVFTIAAGVRAQVDLLKHLDVLGLLTDSVALEGRVAGALDRAIDASDTDALVTKRHVEVLLAALVAELRK